jgi:hypothetical protein
MFDQARHRLGTAIVHDAFVSVAHQTPRDARAHSPEPINPDPHVLPPLLADAIIRL